MSHIYIATFFWTLAIFFFGMFCERWIADGGER